MRREGRIHGYISYRGEFEKRRANPFKPTNQSRRLTGKCGRARCHRCHENPVSKSILKCKGSHKALSLSYISPDWGLRRHHIGRYLDVYADIYDHCDGRDDDGDGDDMPDDDQHAVFAHNGRRHLSCSPSFDLVLPAGFRPLTDATPCAGPPVLPPATDDGLNDSSSDSGWCHVNPCCHLDSLDHINSAIHDDDDDDGDDWYFC